jgi:hypothetical protein
MALVILSIVAAISLAMVSPSEPVDRPAVVPEIASPSPAASDPGGGVPEAQPRIVNPISGKTTRELDFPVTVEVPEETAVKRKDLRLWIKRGADALGHLDQPKTGGTVVVPSVRVAEGLNEITAVLAGPNGPGPSSEPVLITVDREAPELAITAPKDKAEVYEATVAVEGTSEVGAEVLIKNATTGSTRKERVGPSGTFGAVIKLKRGEDNKIVATSVDEAGVTQSAKVQVTRLDGRPVIKLKRIPKVRRASLPEKVKITATVTDEKGKPLGDVSVDFSLGGADRITISDSIYTDAMGKAVWKPSVAASSSTTDKLLLSVTATSPDSGKSRTVDAEIELQ